MAITTMDQLVSSLPGQARPYYKSALAGTFAAGQWVSLWTAAGNPGAGAAQGSINGAIPNATTAGAVPYTIPTAPVLSYLGKAFGGASVIGTLVLYDRLWHDSAFAATTLTAQTVTQPALTRPDANGNQAEVFLEIYTSPTAGTTSTISYTNPAGTSGHTAAVTFASAAPAALMIPFPLAAGDTGVKSIQSMTFTATTTASNIGLTILRRLVEIPILVAQTGTQYDVFALGMPRVLDDATNGACIAGMFLIGSGTAAPVVLSSLNIVQG